MTRTCRVCGRNFDAESAVTLCGRCEFEAVGSALADLVSLVAAKKQRALYIANNESGWCIRVRDCSYRVRDDGPSSALIAFGSGATFAEALQNIEVKHEADGDRSGEGVCGSVELVQQSAGGGPQGGSLTEHRADAGAAVPGQGREPEKLPPRVERGLDGSGGGSRRRDPEPEELKAEAARIRAERLEAKR